MQAISLLGRDYPELGPLGLAELPGAGALALSRGRYPKAYRHHDPNEDSALLVRADAGLLLAVTDGHNGARASEVAIEVVQEHAPKLIGRPTREFRSEMFAIFDDVAARLRGAAGSRTCLILAALGELCEWACFGDASLFRAGSSRPVSPPNRLLLGRGLSLDEPEDLWSGTLQLGPGERIALVTDGITNFTPRLEQIQTALREAPDDVHAARLLAENALRGGAGDNVAVATASAPGP